MPDRIPVRGVRSGVVDHLEVATPEEAHVAALVAERRGYVARGLDDRVAQVDAELQRLAPGPQEQADLPASEEGPPSDEERPAGEAVAGIAEPPRVTSRRTRRK